MNNGRRLVVPYTFAYLPGAAGEAADFPGALFLQAEADLETEPPQSERQEEMDFHPSPPSGTPRGQLPRHQDNSANRPFHVKQKENIMPLFSGNDTP
jgi:hypothetical protein